jgi:hypothetical protein
MKTIIKCGLFLSLSLGLVACNDDETKSRGQAGGGDTSISASQLITSVVMQDVNAEPISVNDKTITDNADPIDVNSL